MAPKKVVPKSTDDIIELTDIVEPGVLPAEDTASGLTDATFEDELDSMLADVPELSAAVKDLDAAPAAKAAPAAAPAAEDDDFADLDSLLEELGDDLADSKPPAPKAPPAAAAEEDALLDVDDLLAEVGAGDKADFAGASEPQASAAAEEDIVDVDKFLTDFEGAEAAAPAASEQVIDATAVGADELLAELQSAAAPEVEEDDLLAELKSVMGGDLPDAPVAGPVQPGAAAPEAEIEPAPEFNIDELDLTALEPEAAASPEPPVSTAEPEMSAPAPEAVPTPMDDDLMAMAAAAMAAPAEPEAPAEAAEDNALADEDLQHLDALLDDILQPTAPPPPAPEPETPAAPEAAAEAAPVDEIALEPESEPEPEPEPELEVAAPASEPEIESVTAEEIPSEPASEPELEAEPAPAVTPVVDTEAVLAELLAEDGPLLATVRDLVRQETETRLTALEERLVENLDKAAAKAAAQIIREEIAALAQDME